MFEPGSTLTIDRQPYAVTGTLELERPDGPSETLLALRHAESDAPFLLETPHADDDDLSPQDDAIWARLLRPVAAPGSWITRAEWRVTLQDEAFGWYPADVPHRHIEAALSPNAPPEVEEPEWQAADGWLILAPLDAPPARGLLGRDLIWDGGADFYSRRHPAREMAQREVPREPPASGGHWLALLLALVLLGLGWVGARPEGRVPFVTIFWILGALGLLVRLGGPTGTLWPAAHLVSSALMLSVCTRLLQTVVLTPELAGEAWRWSAVHAAGSLALMLGLSLLSARLYHAVADAATGAGLVTLFVFTVGILGWSCVDWTWWGGRYGRLLGASPYGYVWAGLFLLWLLLLLRAYRAAPLSLKRFGQVWTELLRDLAHLRPTSEEETTRLADEVARLATALKITREPRLRSALAFADELDRLEIFLRVLPSSWPTRRDDAERAADDLATLVDDLQKVDAQLHRGPLHEPLHALRLSPTLRYVSPFAPDADDHRDAEA